MADPHVAGAAAARPRVKPDDDPVRSRLLLTGRSEKTIRPRCSRAAVVIMSRLRRKLRERSSAELADSAACVRRRLAGSATPTLKPPSGRIVARPRRPRPRHVHRCPGERAFRQSVRARARRCAARSRASARRGQFRWCRPARVAVGAATALGRCDPDRDPALVGRALAVAGGEGERVHAAEVRRACTSPRCRSREQCRVAGMVTANVSGSSSGSVAVRVIGSAWP